MTTWKIDTAHSEILFKIKYLKMTSVTGRLGDFDLAFQTEEQLMKTISDLQFGAAAGSIATFNKERDEMLKSPEFFDAEKHPQITFKANKVDYWGKEPPFNFAQPFMKDYKIYGDLTIKGVTQPVTINALFEGVFTDEHNQSKAGFTFKASISRKDFGIGWEKQTVARRLILSDEVELLGEIQLFKGN